MDGEVVLPWVPKPIAGMGSAKRERPAENPGSLDFDLSDAERTATGALERDGRIVIPPQASKWDS